MRSLLLVVVGLLLGAGPLQVATTAQVGDTTWIVSGQATLKLSGGAGVPSGTQKVKGPGLLQFFAGGGFSFVDATSTSIGGSWSEAGGALQVTVTEDDIDTFLDDNLGALSSALEGLEIGGVSSVAKLTPKKNGVGSLVYKLAFVLDFTVDDVPVHLVYKVAVKGQYDLSGDSADGATFTLDSKQIYKAKGVTVPDTGGLQLVLGPDGGLAADRFVLRDDEGADLYGGYCTRVGNKVFLLPDASALESHVEALIAPKVEELFPGGEVTLEVLVSKYVGSVKKDGTIKLKGKSVFASDLERGPKTGKFKSSYRVKASG